MSICLTYTHIYILPFKSVVCTLLTIDLYYIGNTMSESIKLLYRHTAQQAVKGMIFFTKQIGYTIFCSGEFHFVFLYYIFVYIQLSSLYSGCFFSLYWGCLNKNLYFHFFLSFFERDLCEKIFSSKLRSLILW